MGMGTEGRMATQTLNRGKRKRKRTENVPENKRRKRNGKINLERGN